MKTNTNGSTKGAFAEVLGAGLQDLDEAEATATNGGAATLGDAGNLILHPIDSAYYAAIGYFGSYPK